MIQQYYHMSSPLQVIFDEINRNEVVGTTPCVLHPLLVSNETLEYIWDSFENDPDTDSYLFQLSEVLQIHHHEQQHLFDLLDTFLFQYMAQIKQDKDHPSLPSFPSTSLPSSSSSSLPSSSSSSVVAPAGTTTSLVPPPLHGYAGYTMAGFPQLKNNMILTVPQKKRQNFSREITNVLSQWLFTHCDHPYPSEHEKSVLCSLTGLSLSQVSGWFINARRRKLKKLNESGGSGSPTTATTTTTTTNNVSVPGVNVNGGLVLSQDVCEHVVGKNEIALNFVEDNMEFSL